MERALIWGALFVLLVVAVGTKVRLDATDETLRETTCLSLSMAMQMIEERGRVLPPDLYAEYAAACPGFERPPSRRSL